MAFSHFLITRFNIPNKDWATDKNKQPVQNIEWLNHRINLFETYCLHSIINQSCKKFIWLIYFDENSPTFLREKIAEWENLCKNMIPQYSGDYNALLDYQISDAIKTLLPKETKFIITTRIDNDDAFHKNAIEIIQQHFIPKDNTIIDLEKGYCYNIEKQVITKWKFKSNAFISYIESSNKSAFNTVYREGHPAWIGKADFISITNKRLWLQIIHHKNVANSQKGRIVFSKKKLRNFNIEIRIPFFVIKSLSTSFKKNYLLFKHEVKLVVYKIFGKQIKS
jgi:hypothetical protein